MPARNCLSSRVQMQKHRNSEMQIVMVGSLIGFSLPSFPSRASSSKTSCQCKRLGLAIVLNASRPAVSVSGTAERSCGRCYAVSRISLLANHVCRGRSATGLDSIARWRHVTPKVCPQNSTNSRGKTLSGRYRYKAMAIQPPSSEPVESG